MKQVYLCFFLFIISNITAQKSTEALTLSEYLGYIKAYHPLVKQANLLITESEAKLLKSRGAFDPKIQLEYDRKKFKNLEYFDKLNTSFKIPTWYGIELKAGFEQNEGIFLNPEANIPEDGLYSAGISISVAQGLLINKRMAMLKKAKLFTKQVKVDRQLLVNKIVYEAALTYFNWLKTYNEKKMYESFLNNAETRFEGIKKSYDAGEKPAIDTLEARIVLNSRKLSFEKAKITYTKSSLELSNYLWYQNNTPLQIKQHMIPDTNTFTSIDTVMNTSTLAVQNNEINNHPKLQSLEYKYKSLEIEQRLKRNLLLPKIDVQYNFLSETPDNIQSFTSSAYKSGLNISFPLFLRKQRGDLKLAKLKLQNTEFEIKTTKVILENKIDAITQELQSYNVQNEFTNTIISDYDLLLQAEERKFLLGESSLFLINSRESKLIEAQLKGITLENDYLNTKASLFNVLAQLII
ncbi:TolC family protein [Aquimarina sp. 2201CG5-10]|uniref:TolC family protein n=1 Tax=Aquimarina callyspongiae TaxID=3098150 RepID=UPI002AB3E839|nr:TolC family protein [Aquimarina sp. 2201CG5-10]MDY8135895.1 TolC family protein [Aquimarina sp. 2201CG5-10]